MTYVEGEDKKVLSTEGSISIVLYGKMGETWKFYRPQRGRVKKVCCVEKGRMKKVLTIDI